MDSLRGVFPRPQPPPKRNFLRENALKVRNSSKLSNLDQKSSTGGSQGFKGAVKKISATKNKELIVIKEPAFAQSAETSTRTASQVSQLVETASQTTDVNAERFLDNAIISPSKEVKEEVAREHSSRREKLSEYVTNRIKSYSGYNQELQDEIVSSKADNTTPQTTYDSYHGPKPPTSTCSHHSSHRNGLGMSTPSISQHDHSSGPQTASTIQTNFTNAETENSVPTEVFSKESRINKNIVPSNYKKGVLPKYLQERKVIETREKEKVLREYDPDCPVGHVALSDAERLESLGMAQKKFQNLVNELNKMPMTSETIKTRRRKIEIERELDSLENTIRIFSRQKVYVQIDE